MNDKARRRADDDSLEQLRADFEEHRKENQQAMRDLIAATQANTEAVQKIAESTAGVVQLYADIQGAARVGIALQNFTIWLAKWGVVGASAATVLNYGYDFFKP